MNNQLIKKRINIYFYLYPMQLKSSIDNCDELMRKIQSIRKFKPVKNLEKEMLPTLYVEKKQREILEQLGPFIASVEERIIEYLKLTDNAEINEKYNKIKMKYQTIYETVNDKTLNDNFMNMIKMKNKITEIEDEIKNLKKVICFNYEESVSLFDKAIIQQKNNPEKIEINEELNDLINSKYRFEIEGVKKEECEIIEEMINILEKNNKKTELSDVINE